jgi:nucleoside-diphosphate-sugar epimerase
MDVAVTGAAGFIGTHLTRRLCADDRVHFVKAIDLSCGDSEVFSHNKVVFSQGDIADQCELRSVLRRVDTVFHLASHLEPEGKTGEHSATSQDCGTTSLLLKAASLNGVRRVFLLPALRFMAIRRLFPSAKVHKPTPFPSMGAARWR